MTAIPSGTKFLGIAASVDTTEKRSKLNNSYQEYYTIGDITGTQTTTVNISSEDLINEYFFYLLPVCGLNEYYDIDQIILEYSFGTIPYNANIDAPWRFEICGGENVFIDRTFITSDTNKVVVHKGNNSRYTDSAPARIQYYGMNLGEAVFLVIGSVSDGDGTLRAIITYNVRTFGA
jgi:hypothetical protein